MSAPSTIEALLRKLEFPKEWRDWDMIPSELADMQLRGYRSGHEESPEHDRHGAFNWWLKRNPSTEQLHKLCELTFLDPDQHMASYVRGRIRTAEHCSREIRGLIGEDWLEG